MDGDEESLKKGLEKVSITKRCPKCNGLSLQFNEDQSKLVCEDCGFEEPISKT
ncbi:hypothetical protein ACFLZX_01995 [Nanoarchaeota archaeon]